MIHLKTVTKHVTAQRTAAILNGAQKLTLIFRRTTLHGTGFLTGINVPIRNYDHLDTTVNRFVYRRIF